MAITVVKETIELGSITTDSIGNAFLNKKINLKDGYKHRLLQVDMFADASPSVSIDVETVITPYPAIMTAMDYQPANNLPTRYTAAGDDSILFKEKRRELNTQISSGLQEQFPSSEIASTNNTVFYTDHVFINMHIMSGPNITIENIAYSFLLVLDDKKVSVLEHSLGVLSEQHNAMCANLMSNGQLITAAYLSGNVFPWWRYGGIRPEHMITAIAANSFFLEIATRDEEQMVNTTLVRQSVADARSMSAFDSAFGDRRPDWLRMHLNQGLVAGPIRSNPVPLRYADNGNTRMF